MLNLFKRKVVEKIVEVAKPVYLLGDAVPVTLYERYHQPVPTYANRYPLPTSEGYFLTSEAAFKDTTPTTKVRSLQVYRLGKDYIVGPKVIKLDIKG